MSFAELKRLVLSEMAFNKNITSQRICGFTRKQIINMVQSPERYGHQIIKLMDYVYQKSGYMKRIIDYFSNMAKLNYYIDTDALDVGIFKVNENTLKKNYIGFAAQSTKFNLSNNINEIIKRLYLNDVCYAYVEETEFDIGYYFIETKYCEIKKLINGNVYEFSVDRSMMNDYFIDTLPPGLRNLINESKELSLNNQVLIPSENSFCLKYNNNFLHLFPPFFPMIADILLIDEYKDLSKTKAVNDAYKLLVLKVPTKDGNLTMDDPTLKPFIEVALQVVQENIGVLPYPGEVESVEFSSSNADDRDKVSDAITWTFKSAGVSEALMSGASSGSELKLSIANDSGDIFRIYRMFENWMSLQMKLRGYIYKSYQFVYKILDITIFNREEFIDWELKTAQVGMPNKQRLCAAIGISPSSMLGNIHMEQVVLKDIFDLMQPLKSSFTQSGDLQDEGGRPTTSDGDLTASGEVTRSNDTNNPDNRI